ncbi:MAG: flagellar basal body rod protein FlgB [Alphaproteobacteria bacterium]|nr:flagellar basal body protein [Alphaproteobacteria bacterium]TAD88851.1 MAG: flagellar basal body rod protein FlgB [Alphaproteobacteria bacterium]
MDLARQPLFRMMQDRMGYLTERQKVLAQNIANADTPNYRPSDLKPVNFAEVYRMEQQRVRPAMTQAGHLPPASPQPRFVVDKDRRPFETAPDGNGVVLEDQMLKLAETQGEFGTTSALYRKYLDMMRMAVAVR